MLNIGVILIIFAYYYDVEPFSDKHIHILKQHMLLYKSLGGHAITASIVEEAWGGQTYGGEQYHSLSVNDKMDKKADKEWNFDFTHFDKWVELNKSIGIADKIICYSMMPWNGIIKYFDESKKKYKKVRVNPARKSNYEKYGFRFDESVC